jgi:hypothetical protein
MFATLLGPLPRPALPAAADPLAVLDAVLALQADNGLEPLSDGGWPSDPDPVRAWRTATDRAGGLVKAVVVGPVTSGRPVGAIRTTITALADAGCTWIEVHEPAAIALGADASARAAFADAHQALTDGLAGVHLSLAVVGGSADEAGLEPLLAGSYASLAVDLIEGPDNWRLAAAAPRDRGIICGALSTRTGSDDGPELLLWAAGYAASTRGRGRDRVGLATAGSLAHLPWEVAARKVERLGHAARLAVAPPDERAAGVDPRSIDLRSAAAGRYAPRTRRTPARRTPDRPSGG